MTKVIVSDASTLVLLQKIVLLDKLIKNFDFIIPQEVYNETVVKGKNAKSRDAYFIENKIKNNLIKIKKTKDIIGVRQIIDEFGLGEGEAEAIALFLQENADLLATDDRRAMNACRVHQIPFITALTFVVAAFELKIVDKNDAHNMIRDLSIYGRYKDELIYKAFNCIGETND